MSIITHLNEEMSLLVLQRWAHEQRQDLVEERPGAQVACLVCQLPQGGLPLWGGAILHLHCATGSVKRKQIIC